MFYFPDHEIYDTHAIRWNAIVNAFRKGRINQDELTRLLRGIGAYDGEIRAEIALHERGV